MARSSETMAETPQSPTKEQKKFCAIRFNPAGKNDPPVVTVNVNGEIKLRMRRNEIIPIPTPALEALRNAVQPVFEEAKENGPAIHRRKVVGYRPRFPHEFLGYLSQTSYEALRAIAKKRSITDKEFFELSA